MPSDHSILRISREVHDIQKGHDLSLAVAYRDENVRKVKAVIIGPPDTCYQFGFFEFNINFGTDYPTKSPSVAATTTNSGRTRFNPNIYADGKVCLSILGTWRGEPGEEWSSAQGLESILISIQSLMSSNPYENEPGFEASERGDGEYDGDEAKLYAAKIYHENLRISVIRRLESHFGLSGQAKDKDQHTTEFGADVSDEFDDSGPFDPFIDLYKRRFLWYYQPYLHGIEKEIKTHGATVNDGVAFRTMPFECSSNGMEGHFQYSELKKRLARVRQAIEQETEQWVKNGAKAAENESSVALNFQNSFKSAVKKLEKSDSLVDLEMIDKNPLVWRLTLFGQPMTNLDGGIFKIRIVFSKAFPEEQPRVNVETPLFHQRVSPEGVLCYFAQNQYDVSSHLEGIIEAIEQESPPYDPRTTVHPEAANLLWGDEDSKKQYNRKLRRSAQESSEY